MRERSNWGAVCYVGVYCVLCAGGEGEGGLSMKANDLKDKDWENNC